MENLESHEIYKFHFPGLESLGKSKLNLVFRYSRCQSNNKVKQRPVILNCANSSCSHQILLALLASVWSKNKGGRAGSPGPFPGSVIV